jgi:hypothetical protein
MEKGIEVMKRIGETSAYIILIFMVLILIGWGNKQIASRMEKDSHSVEQHG